MKMSQNGSYALDVPQAGLVAVAPGDVVEIADPDVCEALIRQGWECAERNASPKEIRAWAKENEIDVPSRGAIPADVREKYDAAHAAE